MHFDEVWIWAGEFEEAYAFAFVPPAASHGRLSLPSRERALIACDTAALERRGRDGGREADCPVFGSATKRL